ncbi:MAG: hypothetical protein A2Z99_21180 [Treponema sp. GWB1_62_6]|nr:MAG: hypothetical protein A2Z99_21180 [Treponema sp. GWB1_62_6]
MRLSGISCKNARGGTWTDRHDRNLGSLYVEPNSVILFRNHVSVSAGNWYNYRLNGWLMDSEIERILEMLRADARWPAWDAYSLVNFLR